MDLDSLIDYLVKCVAEDCAVVPALTGPSAKTTEARHLLQVEIKSQLERAAVIRYDPATHFVVSLAQIAFRDLDPETVRVEQLAPSNESTHRINVAGEWKEVFISPAKYRVDVEFGYNRRANVLGVRGLTLTQVPPEEAPDVGQ